MDLTIKNYMKIVDASPDKLKEYNERYAAVKNSITNRWYSVGKKLILHTKIPSEKDPKIYYDVLLEFPVDAQSSVKNFRNASMRVFSNCPSFAFINYHYCRTHNMSITWADGLYGPNAKKEPSADKEPQELIRCEKSLYFAVKFINDMDNIALLTSMGSATKLLNERAVLIHIRKADKVLVKRASVKVTPKKKTPEKKKPNASNEYKTGKIKLESVIGKSSKTRHTKGISKISKIKHI